MNLENALNKASQTLFKSNIKSSLLDSEILMSKAINKDRKFIISNLRKVIDMKFLNYFNKLVSERASGKPISYILGTKEFWNFKFKIIDDVLIPRPDTEILVEEALKITKYKKKLKILDIGVGSGCILLSLLKEREDFRGIGIDFNKKCIDLSRLNAQSLNIENRVKFLKRDIDNFNYGKYDLIVSNPPYIKQIDLKYLDKDIKYFEPRSALNGGLDGLSEIRKVINKSSELIKLNGRLILEIGFDQKLKVKQILINKGFFINKIVKDYAKNDRCIICTKTKSNN
tara:strand:+ start:2553 stop:3407 length:855 start_codon:yes stop_codon:yes gene_type:complete